MTTGRLVLRSIACTMGLGFGWGTLAAAVPMVAQLSLWGGLLSIALVAAVYGGGIGAAVGLVMGLPTVFMVYPLHTDLPRCRRVGAAWAAALPAIGAGGLAVVGGDAAGGAAVLGVFTIVVAWSAWFGLGWIFRPTQPRS